MRKGDIAKKKKIKTRKGTLKREKKVTKKLHVYGMFKKQNLADTLKSYAMRNLQTKYKILQKVKIM